MNLILFHPETESPDESAVKDRGSESEGEEKEWADDADDSCGDTSQAIHESGEADQDLDNSRENSSNVADEHPIRNNLVFVQAGFKLFAKELVRDSVIQFPDIDGVEPEVVLAWGAKCDMIFDTAGAVSKVTGTVVPEADVIKIFNS